MATLTSKAVSELAAATSLTDADLFAISQGGASKKINAKDLREALPRMRSYVSVTELGLASGSATIDETYSALPTRSFGVFVSNDFTSGEVPATGLVIIFKSGWDTRGTIVLSGMSESGIIYVKNVISDGTYGHPAESWKKILVDDTGWVNLTLESAFAANPGNANNIPKYRRIGNTVYLHGVVSPTSELAAGWTEYKICTLPSGARPQYGTSHVCHGSGLNKWLLSVHADGGVFLSRYGTSELAAVPTAAWLPFDVSFTVS